MLAMNCVIQTTKHHCKEATQKLGEQNYIISQETIIYQNPTRIYVYGVKLISYLLYFDDN